MKETLHRIIDQFKSKKILVIGDAILDTYVKGEPNRISREAPVLVFNVQNQEHQCGGAANTAINAAMLGAETYFLTVIGKDANARELVDVLKRNGVNTEYILKDKSRITIAKKRITAGSNILMRIDEGSTGSISASCEKEMLDRLWELYAYMDAIIFSDYGYGTITNTIINAVKAQVDKMYKPVIVDAKDASRFKKLRPAAVKPNYEEAIKLLSISKQSTERASQVLAHEKELFEITGAENVAVTLDSDGVILLQPGKQPYPISCVARDNKNSIGAGDSFVSALALAFASKAEPEVAAEIAAAAAAVVVQKDGTAGCTNQQLKSYFNSVPKHILCNEELSGIVKGLRSEGKKIVFTNGCFDILHKGHITLLKRARDEGDVLIVGVNNDESIRKVKGSGRPINSLEDRITVLAGLQSVDYLISFEEESPVNLIKAVHPDVFVKGGNYTENSIPEANVLKKIGCRIKIIPYMEDYRTTTIINKIQHINEKQETLEKT